MGHNCYGHGDDRQAGRRGRSAVAYSMVHVLAALDQEEFESLVDGYEELINSGMGAF